MNGLSGFSKFAEKYEAQTSINALDKLFLEVVRELFGYPFVTYGNGVVSDTFIYTTTSTEWWTHYVKEKYVSVLIRSLPCCPTHPLRSCGAIVKPRRLIADVSA